MLSVEFYIVMLNIVVLIVFMPNVVNLIVTFYVVIMNAVMLSVTFFYCDAEYFYADCFFYEQCTYTDCHILYCNADCLYAQCHYTDSHILYCYAECIYSQCRYTDCHILYCNADCLYAQCDNDSMSPSWKTQEPTRQV